MFLDLKELNNKDVIEFDYTLEKDDELDKRILDLKDAKAIGRIYNSVENNVVLECEFNGTMYISDSITLESVPYDFTILIEENLDDLIENYEGCYDYKQLILDLKKILWQNIVLEVPISYTLVNDASIKGNGWELVDEKKRIEEVDPRLKKLEELLERRG